MNSSVSPFLSLAAVIHALRGSVGGWSVRGVLSVALGLLVYRRLGVIGARMERLAARFVAGRLSRPVTVSGVRRVSAGSGVRVVRARIWPCGFGWLVKAASWQAAGYGCQLRAVLETPEMVALLTAAPQAVRVLRPLCRMLAIETRVLRPGVVVEAVAADVPKLVRRKRAPVDMGRIPIPRGVMAAVRRGRYAEV